MTDAVLILALAFLLGAIFGAVLTELLVAPRLNQLTADNDHLRALIFPLDRDGDGRPGGSKPR